jgi:sec-independent protein translocase protein TatA
MNLLDVIPVTVATFSPMDMGIIFFVILIFFGAKKLPEFARSMGQAVREFSKAKDDFQREITRDPEPDRTPALDQRSEPYHDSYHADEHDHTEPSQTVETHPVENVAKPEGTKPYEPGIGTTVATASTPVEESAPKA